MLELNKYKQILKKNGINDLAEEEIVKLRDNQDQMAEVLYNMWRTSINTAKSQKINV